MQDPIDRHDRGTTLVEYALLVALVAGVAMGAVRFAQASYSATLAALGRQISVGSDGTGGAPPATSSPPPTTVVPAPPSTAPPTTKASTTTTTAPKVMNGSGAFTPVATTIVNGFFWNAQTTLTAAGSDGKPIAGAGMDVLVRYPQKDWFGNVSWQESTIHVTTGPDGTASVAGGPYFRGTGAFSVSQVEFRLTGVTLPGGTTWDGQQASVSGSAP